MWQCGHLGPQSEMHADFTGSVFQQRKLCRRRDVALWSHGKKAVGKICRGLSAQLQGSVKAEFY